MSQSGGLNYRSVCSVEIDVLSPSKRLQTIRDCFTAGPSLNEIKKQRRFIWAVTRSVLEADTYKHRKHGEKSRRNWSFFEILIWLFGKLLQWTPLFEKGKQNAENTVLNRVDLRFQHLPESFHGYTILHMTDLHLDSLPDIPGQVLKHIAELDVDLCVLTGDYRKQISGGFKAILTPLERIVASIRHRDGILATLGNHDTFRMVEPFEEMGITLLANESIKIVRNDTSITITGLDDAYYYYTDQSVTALEEAPDGFKIALVHSPSLFDGAAANGYSLYLTGHTHGGQISLPGGIPVIRHLRHGRRYYRGLWQYRDMTGYTGQGVGTVGIPVRFNTRSEITLFSLLRS